MIDMGDNREIAYKALQSKLISEKNRFIIVTAPEVVKEIAPPYNPRRTWVRILNTLLHEASNHPFPTGCCATETCLTL